MRLLRFSPFRSNITALFKNKSLAGKKILTILVLCLCVVQLTLGLSGLVQRGCWFMVFLLFLPRVPSGSFCVFVFCYQIKFCSSLVLSLLFSCFTNIEFKTGPSCVADDLFCDS